MTLYETYVKKYNNAKAYNKEKELPGMITDKYDKKTFKVFYEATRQSLLEEGKTASVGQVIKEMVDRQQFSASKQEAKVLVDAMAKRGYDVSLAEARAFKGFFRDEASTEEFYKLNYMQRAKAKTIEAFYDEVAATYRTLRAGGKSASEAKRMISTIYFGSE